MLFKKIRWTLLSAHLSFLTICTFQIDTHRTRPRMQSNRRTRSTKSCQCSDKQYSKQKDLLISLSPVIISTFYVDSHHTLPLWQFNRRPKSVASCQRYDKQYSKQKDLLISLSPVIISQGGKALLQYSKKFWSTAKYDRSTGGVWVE
jgi:hypothetical protein